MAPAPWDSVPSNETFFVLVTGANRYVGSIPSTGTFADIAPFAAASDSASANASSTNTS